jgi:hypothetical protein
MRRRRVGERDSVKRGISNKTMDSIHSVAMVCQRVSDLLQARIVVNAKRAGIYGNE